MKKYILPTLTAIAVLSFACKDKTADENKSKDDNMAMPMPVAYKGKASIGSNDNTVKVMNWNKWLSTGQLDSAFSLLADSVTVRLSTGETINASVDTAKSIIRGYFGMMNSTKVQYVAVLPVDVKLDNNSTNNWVLSWTDEAYDMKNGKKDHFIIHEDYRLMNGKIREINQYSRVVPDSTAAKK